MKELSRIVSSIPPSETLAVSDKAKALKAAGRDVVALAGGDPDFDTPDYITAAAFQAIENGATHYPAPMKGITPLLEAIAHKMQTDNGITLKPGSDIVVTPGGKWALFLALSAILNPGDEVLYLEPVWVSYPPMIVLAGGTPVAHPLVPHTLAFFGDLAPKLILTHFNHTNPLLDEGSAERAMVQRYGAAIACEGQIFSL